METREMLTEVYRRLHRRYGPQSWWPGDTAFEIIVGAILTQSIAWSNVEKALTNLRAAGVLSPRGLRDISLDNLAALLRPSGYFNVKAKRLKAVIEYLWEEHQGNLESLFDKDATSLRKELLSIYGIGEETADDIVLYAAGKPSFVIDAYTRRILDRAIPAHGASSYVDYQQLFHDALPRDSALFNEYHALLVQHGKDVCKKVPRCRDCCLLEVCSTGTKTLHGN